MSKPDVIIDSIEARRLAKIEGRIAGLKEAAALCRLYRDVWSESAVLARDHHIAAAQSLKKAIDQKADILRRRA